MSKPIPLSMTAGVELLATTQNLLLIQDLDGVCMGLVKDPLNRVISTDYVEATKGFEGHFYVLTNGEHVGQRGINGIIERAFGDADQVRAQRHYLPGLAAGGCAVANPQRGCRSPRRERG